MDASNKEERCCICNHYNSQGIWLVDGYICASCLAEISSTDVHDPKYDYFVSRLKELWRTG